MTPNKERALAALMKCRTKAEAAEVAGIDPRTLRRYFDDTDFQEAYKKAFGGMVEDATRQAQQAIAPALSTLREIMEDSEETAAARIQAARSTLEYALKLTEQNDILEQLRELEEEMGVKT